MWVFLAFKKTPTCKHLYEYHIDGVDKDKIISTLSPTTRQSFMTPLFPVFARHVVEVAEHMLLHCSFYKDICSSDINFI